MTSDAFGRPRTMAEKRRHRALLVDYGGVLTTSMSASFAAFCLATGVNPERLKLVLAPAYRGDLVEEPGREELDDLVAAVETGRLPVEEFNRRLAMVLSEGLERPVDAIDLAARLFGGAAPDDVMIEAVREARSQGLKTALVSNTWGLREPSPWSDELFDSVVLSGREGVRKPDPKIFHIAADRVGVHPTRCVFVDDIAANVDGARAVGMAGVLHRHPDITIPKLEELLGIKLTPPSPQE
jgi:epoxide hydrolase-like predicted phosphatase